MPFNVSAYDFGSFNATRDVAFFYSRPDLYSPMFAIHSRDPKLSDSSYFFVSPKAAHFAQNGPYIFDALGQLVWAGATSTAAVGLRVCAFQSVPHLCLWEGDDSRTSLGMGVGKILDANYEIAAEIKGSGTREPVDFHEFHTVEMGTRAIVTIYRGTPYDLSPYKDNLKEQIGWVWNCGFQEIDIETGNVTFEWWALDHVDPAESLTPINLYDGQTRTRQWDYFHINSVAKSDGGDYIISGRHTNCIYRISGTTGAIIWRLGGTKSDFSADFKFGFQHDVRIHGETESYMMLSLFNNGWDGRHEAVTNISSGLMIQLDINLRTATLKRSYTANITSTSQGNMELIPRSNNILLNHGDATWLTEFTTHGSIALIASIGGNSGSNYLAVKGPWVGKPNEPPSVFAYAKTVAHPLALYASWNGATEVGSWRFYGVDDEHGDNVTELGVQIRDGFETSFVHHRFYRWAFAEAIGSDGESLGNSSVKQTWSPGARLAQSCSDTTCPVEALTKNMDYGKGAHDTRPVRASVNFPLSRVPALRVAMIEKALALVGGMWMFLWALRIVRFRLRSSRQRPGIAKARQGVRVYA